MGPDSPVVAVLAEVPDLDDVESKMTGENHITGAVAW